MSKDYKLGVLFSLLVLGAGVIYWVALDKSDNKPQKQQKKETPKVQIVDVPDVSGTAEKSAGVKESTTGTEGTAAPDDAATVPTSPTTVTDETTPAGPAIVSAAPPTPHADDSGTSSNGFQIDPNADSVVNADDPIITPTPVPVPEPVKLAKKGEYIVRAGDNGFSVVSTRLYGTPKYWKLIRDANPGVLSTALRIGMKLKIPQLPVEDITTPKPVSPVTHGKTFTNAAGQRIYVVASDDTSGLWGIAGKVYGENKGYLYPLIQEANPKVNTTNLKAGMKLIIPPPKTAKHTIPVMRKSRNRVEPGQIIMIGAKRYYIVKPGDAGFGYIAKKVYGSVRYAYLIKNANPNANSTTLMPRDKLLLPPKPTGQEARPITGTRTAHPATRQPGRPYFGN